MTREPDGYYYLHENGNLIYKRLEPDPSDFVRKVWPIYLDARDSAWLLAIEALALGTNWERIEELATKWGLTDDDAKELVKHATLGDDTPAFRLFKDGDRWCATFHDFVNLQESQAGFGSSALEAFAELAKPGLLRKQLYKGDLG